MCIWLYNVWLYKIHVSQISNTVPSCVFHRAIILLSDCTTTIIFPPLLILQISFSIQIFFTCFVTNFLSRGDFISFCIPVTSWQFPSRYFILLLPRSDCTVDVSSRCYLQQINWSLLHLLSTRLERDDKALTMETCCFIIFLMRLLVCMRMSAQYLV